MMDKRSERHLANILQAKFRYIVPAIGQ
jgi:hypothetical protein